MRRFNLMPKSERERNPEEYGRNIETRLIFIRHGEKDPQARVQGLLTEQGKQQFRDFALRELNNPERSLVIYGTDTARTIQSGFEAMHVSKADVKVYPEILDELSLNIGSRDPSHPQKISDKFLGQVLSRESGRDVQHYLAFRDKRPDANTLSPRELAAGLAKIILDYSRKAGNIKSNTKTDVLNVSHDFVLGAFLQEALGVQMIDDSEKPLQTAEPFYVQINTDVQGNMQCNAEFRGKRYDIDLEDLEKLARFHYENENKKDKE